MIFTKTTVPDHPLSLRQVDGKEKLISSRPLFDIVLMEVEAATRSVQQSHKFMAWSIVEAESGVLIFWSSHFYSELLNVKHMCQGNKHVQG